LVLQRLVVGLDKNRSFGAVVRHERNTWRPAKLYRCSDRQLDFTLPPRRYALAGHLLALAITAARSAGSERALGRV